VLPGRAARKCWLEIPKHFTNVTLDAFVMMPDHLHGIVTITDSLDRNGVWAQHAAPLQRIGRSALLAGPQGPARGSLGAIVRGSNPPPRSESTKCDTHQDGRCGNAITMTASSETTGNCSERDVMCC